MKKKYCLTLEKEPLPEKPIPRRYFSVWRVCDSSYTLVCFPTGTVVFSDDLNALEEIAKLLKASPDLKILVVGHTDNQGEVKYNQDLSKRRAESVVKALTSEYGIAGGRLSAHGVGMLSPVASNDSDDGKAKNRRVELVKQ